MTKKNLLVWESLQDFGNRFNQALDDCCVVEAVDSLPALGNALSKIEPALLFFESGQLSECGEELMRMAFRLRPRLPIVLVDSPATANCYWHLQMYGLSAAISPDLAFSKRQLSIFHQHLTAENPEFSLTSYFPPDRAIARQRLESPGMRNFVLEAVLNDFGKVNYVSAHDLQLIYEEILNNAIFHALRPHEAQAMRLGSPVPDEPFSAHEEIVVEWAVTEDCSAISITDNQGLLSQQDVWDRFFRQTSMAGLLDTDGRGLYLAHLLSRQVAVTISPGLRTQISVFFDPEPSGQEKLISVRLA